MSINTKNILSGFYSSNSSLLKAAKFPPGPNGSSYSAPTTIPTVPPGDDPSPIINPQKIGYTYYSKSRVASLLKARGLVNGQLDLNDPTQLMFIGETKNARKYYINPMTGKPEYMLYPAAALAWFDWRDEMKASGVKYKVSSGYRSYAHQLGLGNQKGASGVAKAGTSPHGFGGALDFSNLYHIVNGKTDPASNLKGRKNQTYIDIASIGAKHGWFNPWRLADNTSMEEIWHFEYWGAA